VNRSWVATGSVVRGASILCLLGTLAACSAKVNTRNFAVSASRDANRDSPVAVDLVIVREEALVPTVTAMSARQWFMDRDQMARDHPASLEFQSWEFVPGQIWESSGFPLSNRSGYALVVFADYQSEGVHRVRVDPIREFRLVLRAEGFETQELR